MCYKRLTLYYDYHFIVLTLVILYQFIIYPLFYRCLPRVRITTRCLFAIVIFFLRILFLLALDVAVYHPQVSNNDTLKQLHNCIFVDKPSITISYKLLLIPSVLDALSHFLLVSSALEYIWALTPSNHERINAWICIHVLGPEYTNSCCDFISIFQ